MEENPAGTKRSASESGGIRSLVDRYPDAPLALLLVAVTTVLFWPASEWIARQTLAHDQLRQSFLLLLFGAVVLWTDHRKKLVPTIAVSRTSIALLGGAFLLMAAGILVPNPFMPLTALALAIGAFVHVLYGSRGLKISWPWLAAFGAFLLFVLVFHLLDWPLRRAAGLQAGRLLSFLGNEVALGEIARPRGILLLSVNGRLFEVAAECNGFGLISSSGLLALLLVVSRPLPLWWKIIAVTLAFLAGFFFNLLRILGIVILAPYFPDHYMFLHETLGLIALFGGLGFIWWLLRSGKTKSP